MVPTFNYIHITITLVPLASPDSTGMTKAAATAIRFLTPDSPAQRKTYVSPGLVLVF